MRPSHAARLLACLSGWLLATDAQAADRQTIADIRGLSAAAVDMEPEVQTGGLVTWRQADNMIIEDDGGAIFVNLYESRRRGLSLLPSLPADIVPGTVVSVAGRLIAGGFAPVILPRDIGVRGATALPAPRRTTADRFFTGADDCQLVEIEGIVQGVAERDGAIDLSLARDGRPFQARLDRGVFGDELTALVDARVRIAGVAMTRFNTRGELLMPSLQVSQVAWLSIISPPRAPPFESPKVRLGGLAGFAPEPADGHLVRVEGMVVHAIAGQECYLQEGATGVRITTSTPLDLRPGNRVEAAGFIDRRGRVAGLTNALVRRIAEGVPPVPLTITPDEIVAINVRSAGSFIKATPGDYENCLVTFPALLMEKQQTHGGGSLLLVAGKTSVVAQLSAVDYHKLAGVEAGSELSMTGIVHTDWSGDAMFRGAPLLVLERIKLLVRSADDVVVVRGPPWWTPRRLLVAVAGLAVLVAAATAWVMSLRRQVQRQARRIAEEIRLRREAAVEFEATLRERSRLAVNLHDTVLQTVTGIGYQVSACKDEAGHPVHDVDRHFGLVERMVGHAVRQLRGTVWALRATAPDDRPLPEAVRELALRLGEEHDAVIDVTVRDGLPEVADYVAGNLLLITQEAVLNALRHADAAAIAVRLGPGQSGPGTIELTIRDDGCGFDTGAAPTARQGHFGLEGMRERADRLGGTLSLTSQPGHGTTVCVCVPAQVGTPSERTAYDEAEDAPIVSPDGSRSVSA